MNEDEKKLLDELAAKAMAAIITGRFAGPLYVESEPERTAEQAYQYARAMLEQRKREHAKGAPQTHDEALKRFDQLAGAQP